MLTSSRREFLGASVAALACGTVFGAQKEAAGQPGGSIDTLFLTWQRDPTTTMTIQWIGPDRAAADAIIRFSTIDGKEWKNQPTVAKAYPQSEHKVFRA